MRRASGFSAESIVLNPKIAHQGVTVAIVFSLRTMGGVARLKIASEFYRF
jgi:hypothetical protein